MNKKILLIVIVVVVLAAIGGYFMIASRAENIGTSILSEQSNTVKYNEYFRSIYLGKIAVGQEAGYGVIPQVAAVFTKGKDQFCTVLEAKKEISKGMYASAIYDVSSKTYIKQKTAFPGVFALGTNAGCGSIPVSAGKYEYKAYLNDVLVFVFPFEVEDSSSQNSPVNVPANNGKDNNSVASNPVLEFSAGGCDSSMDPYTEPFEGIISKNWSSNVLMVSAYVKTLCEGININGSYSLSGNSLVLKIDMTHSGQQGECYCARKLTYKIYNLVQKEYQISVLRGE